MPWEEVEIDDEFKQVMPETHRVDTKVEDWHRTDMPGCPRHPTAGAIMQHLSWTDPDGTRHNRFVGIALCAECSAQVGATEIQSIARSEYDR